MKDANVRRYYSDISEIIKCTMEEAEVKLDEGCELLKVESSGSVVVYIMGRG